MSLRNTNGKYMMKNIYLAAYLAVRGYDVVLKAEGNGRFTFWVDIDDKLEGIVDGFYENKGNVEPIEYSVALKDLKKQMYEN